jgi:hypothetical protein
MSTTLTAVFVLWAVIHACCWLGTGAGTLFWLGRLFRFLHFVEMFTWRWLFEALSVYRDTWPPAFREWRAKDVR